MSQKGQFLSIPAALCYLCPVESKKRQRCKKKKKKHQEESPLHHFTKYRLDIVILKGPLGKVLIDAIMIKSSS